MRTSTPTVLSLTFALAVAARADGPPATTDAERKRGADLVAAWTAVEPALCGESDFGVHMNGPANVGSVHVKVAAAPAGSGATWSIQVDGRQGLGAGQTQKETILLDEHLALVSAESIFGESAGVRSRRARRPGGGWSVLREQGGRTIRGDEPGAATPNYAEDWVLALLARRIAATPGLYELPGLEWVSRNGVFIARAQAVVIEVTAPTVVPFRGRAVQAALVRAWLGARGPIVHIVDAEGHLLEIDPGGGVQVVAGSPAEVTADLPTPPLTPDQEAVRAAVSVWFRVLTKLDPPEALDPLLDWAALRAARGAAPEEDVAAFAERMKRELRESPAPPSGVGTTPEQTVRRITGMLVYEVTGDEAAVKAGGRVAMRLRRGEAGWRITELTAPPH